MKISCEEFHGKYGEETLEMRITTKSYKNSKEPFGYLTLKFPLNISKEVLVRMATSMMNASIED